MPADFLCTRCMCWHDGPKCKWNTEARCVECGTRVGYPAAEQPRDGRCNRCWLRAQGMVIPEVA